MKEIKKFQIGKNGLTEGFIEQLKNYFDKSHAGIAKVEILKSACRDKKDAKRIGEEIVEGLGKRFDYKLVGYVLTIGKWKKG